MECPLLLTRSRLSGCRSEVRVSPTEKRLIARNTIVPRVFGGEPVIRDRRLAVEHVLGMLAAGDTPETVLEGYPWLEREDIQACLLYDFRHVTGERVELSAVGSGA
jgi:uncharacterized protein (DUF433 family)